MIRTTKRSLHAPPFGLARTALRYAAVELPLSPDTTYAPTIQVVKNPRPVPPITSDILYLPQGDSDYDSVGQGLARQMVNEVRERDPPLAVDSAAF